MPEFKLKVALLEITKRCNLNCLICGSDAQRNVVAGELTIDDWIDVSSHLKSLGLELAVLSGGEPTLKNGLEKLVRHFGNLSLEYSIITNGLEFPTSLLKTIKRIKPVVVGFSIDGQPENHDHLRGEGSFYCLHKTICLLQHQGIPVSVNTTVHKDNLNNLPWLLEFINKMAIPAWQIQLAMPFGRMKNLSDLVLSQKEFAELIIFIYSARKNFPHIRISASDDFAYAPGGLVRDEDWCGCSAGLSSLAIGSCGEVWGCLSLNACPPEDNLRRRPIEDIWHDPNLFAYNRQFKEADLNSECQKCEEKEICRGGCNSQSFSMTGRFNCSPFCFLKAVKGSS
ncbi:MAG: radical SAM protein [Candidatus Buchananbacteria bacterium]|nr:radical SAM protein [Candidatus Buchananbacteria bacterium]